MDDVCGTIHSEYDDKSIAMIPLKKTYESAKKLCQNLGGAFPMFKNEVDIITLQGTGSGVFYDGTPLKSPKVIFLVKVRQNRL